MAMMTQSELKHYLHYDPWTGVFTWIRNSNRGRVRVGQKAGTPYTCHSGKTYIRIGYSGRQYGAHRLAFLYITGKYPPQEVDHINGDGTDNTWTNLRRVDKAANGRNQKIHSNNSSGVAGVYWNRNLKKWHVQISVNRKRKHVCFSDSLLEAVCSRKAAERKYGYHPNHGQLRGL